MKWLADNPVGQVLAGISGAMVLLLLVIALLWVLPAGSRLPEGVMDEDAEKLDIVGLADTVPIENFVVITERPLFNESRQPIIELQLDDEDALAEGEGLADEDEVETPEFTLTGVVITPSIRMVTLKPQDSADSLVAFVGRPLKGNFGSWRVSSIEAREVVLTSGDGEELLLNLQVHDTTIEAPAVSKPPTEEEAEPSEELQVAHDDDEPLTRAEEIRRRIAERREELKRAAEQSGANDDEPSRTSYQDAINTMISRGRKRQPEAQDEEE